jgi:hypothetical protein
VDSGQPLPSGSDRLPPNCPICGEVMEPGTIVPAMAGFASGIYWVRSGEEVPSAIAPSIFPEDDILAYRRFHFAEIPGQICRKCKVVMGRFPGWPPPKTPA